jgi:hypothetical protein
VKVKKIVDIILMLFLAWQLQRYIVLKFLVKIPSQIHYYCPAGFEECASDLS